MGDPDQGFVHRGEKAAWAISVRDTPSARATDAVAGHMVRVGLQSSPSPCGLVTPPQQGKSGDIILWYRLGVRNYQKVPEVPFPPHPGSKAVHWVPSKGTIRWLTAVGVVRTGSFNGGIRIH